MDEKKSIRIKRIIGIVSLVTVVAILGYLTYFFMVEFSSIKSVDNFKAYVDSFGVWGVLVGFGLQLLQVFVAFIPGEVVEVGLGFAYGSIGGTLICYAGCFVASTIVFLAVKKFGIKFIELFVSMEQINSMKFVKNNINNPSRLKAITFLLFLIPGTPKDLFTYIFALTPLKYSEFIVISLIARIPSVISSTIGGNLIANGDYITAIILFAATALVSVAGWFCYNGYSKKKNKQN